MWEKGGIFVIRTLYRFIIPHKVALSWATLLGVLTVASNIGLLATSGYLIASAALHPSTVLLLWVPIVGVRFFGMARAVFRYGERYFSHDLTFRILSTMRTWFYDRLEPLAPARLFTFRSGDVLSSAVSDVDTLQDLYLRAIAPPLIAIVVMVIVFLLLSLFSIQLGVIQIVILLVAGLGVPGLTYLLGNHLGSEIVQLRSSFTADLVDTIQGMSDILAFSQEEKAISNLSLRQRYLVQKQIKMASIGGLTNGLMIFLNHFSMWVLLLVAIPMVQLGKITGVDLTVIAQTALASFEAVLPLPLAFQYLGRGFASMRHLLDLLDAKPAVVDGKRNFDGSVEPSLVINQLFFRYLPDASDVIKNISFELTPGKHTAIVGPSGAGKSSLVQVLARFFDYEKGTINLGNDELKDYTIDAIHQQIAVSPQKPHLFNTSVKQNLQLARPNANVEEIEIAAKIALADRFIQKLPEQYDTFIGEQGYKLSGGERQRLAIARVVLSGAPINIFDEPTSGMDAITEEQLLVSIHEALRGKSMLWITHRLTGLELMDEILVMSRGEIVERGTHDELLEKNGLYRQMWDVQKQLIEQQEVAI